VQCGPSNEVTSFRLMSQHTLRGLMYEAAKYSREMRTCLNGPISPLIDQRARIVWASFAQGSPPSVGSNDSDATTLITQSVPHELLISSGCHVLHLPFSRSGVNQCGDGSKLTEASKKKGLWALCL